MQKSVVITGVSSGIGREIARDLVARGYRVFGSVRNANDAARVRADLGEALTPLVFDVTDTTALADAVALVGADVGHNGLAALINNAGINSIAPLMHVPLAEVRRIFEVNVVGVIAVTQAFLPLLGARSDAPHRPGRIVIMSSVSGAVTFPLFGAYSASKHAVESLTDALRRELSLYGIDVVAIEPGTVRTPIVDKVGAIDSRYAATDYAAVLATMPEVLAREVRNAIPMERVTRAVREAIEARRPRTRYPLTPLWRARHLPDRLLDRIANRQMGIVAANR